MKFLNHYKIPNMLHSDWKIIQTLQRVTIKNCHFYSALQEKV